MSTEPNRTKHTGMAVAAVPKEKQQTEPDIHTAVRSEVKEMKLKGIAG